MSAGIKAQYIILVPSLPGSVPPGSLFFNQDGDYAAFKKLDGNLEKVQSPIVQLLTKKMILSGAVTKYAPLAKLLSGHAVAADSDGSMMICGFALQAGVDGDVIEVVTIGVNLKGALLGKGFATGKAIYVSENAGYTDDPASYTGNDDTIFKVGIADCEEGIASSEAKDLIVFPQLVMKPSV